MACLVLHAALCGLFAAREAILGAVTAIDADIKKMVRKSAVCTRLMTVPGVGPITALAFAAAMTIHHGFKRSRDVGAYLGLVPRRHQSGEIDYTGSISKRGDTRVRTLLYEAANVMLTRYAGPLKLKTWALAIGARSTMRKARVALARRLAIILHAMMRDQTEFQTRSERSDKLNTRIPKSEFPSGTMPEGGRETRRQFCSNSQDQRHDCGFHLADPHPANPIMNQRVRREQRQPLTSKRRKLRKTHIDRLENRMGGVPPFAAPSATVCSADLPGIGKERATTVNFPKPPHTDSAIAETFRSPG